MRIFRHLSYANVTATLALVFAMSGGALAMSHYVIEKTSQIKPSVIKKLKGHNGATGPKGAGGPAGPQGTGGPAGPAGSTGPAGAPNPNATTVNKQSVTPLFATAIPAGASVQVFSGQGLTLTFSCPTSVNAKLVATGPASAEAILVARYNATEVRASSFGSAGTVIAEGNFSTGVAEYATASGHVVSLNYGTEDGSNGAGGSNCAMTGEAISG
jgi:hypothetical protein